MNPLRTFILSFLILPFASVAFGQHEKPADKPADEPKKEPAVKEPVKDPKAVDILKAADEATKKIESVRYKASFARVGGTAPSRPATEATIVASGESDSAGFKFRITAKLPAAEGGTATEFTVGSDGDTFYLVDPQKKIVYEDIDSAVMGRTGQQISRGIAMAEFTHPTPFTDEINGSGAELQASESVGGVECDVVHVTYANVPQDAVWYFGKKDHLPRRVVRNSPTADGSQSKTDQIVTDLTVDPKFTDDPFKLVVPEGFTKSDDFAP
ncbi:MAG: DUF2092 domain-containing protein [Phycisphaerales bacterium]|nr:DUF2092 domain-containing protein [Phycisphaerales bacterium]